MRQTGGGLPFPSALSFASRSHGINVGAFLGITDGGTLSRHGRRIRHRRSTDPAHMNAEDERICIFMVTTDGKHVIIVVNKKSIKQWGGD